MIVFHPDQTVTSLPVPLGKGDAVNESFPHAQAGGDIGRVLQRYLFRQTTDDQKLK